MTVIVHICLYVTNVVFIPACKDRKCYQMTTVLYYLFLYLFHLFTLHILTSLSVLCYRVCYEFVLF